MTLFPPAREEGRALRWGARRLSFSTAEEGAILSVLEMGDSAALGRRRNPAYEAASVSG